MTDEATTVTDRAGTDPADTADTAGGVGGGTAVTPGGELVPVRSDTGEPLPQAHYRELFARVDAGHAELEATGARLEAARAEAAEAERVWAEVENQAHALWWQLRGRLRRRGRHLEALPPPDPDAPAGIDVDGLLNEAAAVVSGEDAGQAAHRMPHWLIMPICGAAFGALGFGFTRLWLHLAGVNVVGALGLAGLLFGPLSGVVVGLRWRAHHDGGPVETEPAPALLGFAVAAAAEVALHFTLG
ncbi:MAG TPA: hypothetical protein VFX70_00835 [Mycobacteriales bacterium]|nr:hypothetical protein [Mycobacteriales bacterium]